MRNCPPVVQFASKTLDFVQFGTNVYCATRKTFGLSALRQWCDQVLTEPRCRIMWAGQLQE